MLDCYYALGGGLGHITRALNLLKQDAQQSPNRKYLLITNTFSVKVALPGYIEHCCLPLHINDKKELAKWLDNILKVTAPTRLWVDSFPCGILGELPLIHSLPSSRIYISRLLNWPRYQHRIDRLIAYDLTYFVEDPTKQQFEAMRPFYGKMKQRQCYSLHAPQQKPHLRKSLVLHSGNVDELHQLVEKSIYTDVDLISLKPITVPHKKITWLPQYPLTINPFNYHDLVCAAGFNSFHQWYHHPKVQFMPFERALDLQHIRVARKNRSLM